MVSKTSSVRSIRLQNELWTWLSEEAARRETTLNGLASDLLEVAKLRAAEAAAGAKVPPTPKSADVTPEKVAKAARPKPVNTVEKFTLPRAAPGSRLKKR